jgi:hypothetical protein
MTKKKDVDAVSPKMASRYQKIFILWGLGQG